eukprot:jgi/Tetstr1/463436/TSEL_000740.t2
MTVHEVPAGSGLYRQLPGRHARPRHSAAPWRALPTLLVLAAGLLAAASGTGSKEKLQGRKLHFDTCGESGCSSTEADVLSASHATSSSPAMAERVPPWVTDEQAQIDLIVAVCLGAGMDLGLSSDAVKSNCRVMATDMALRSQLTSSKADSSPREVKDFVRAQALGLHMGTRGSSLETVDPDSPLSSSANIDEPYEFIESNQSVVSGGLNVAPPGCYDREAFGLENCSCVGEEVGRAAVEAACVAILSGCDLGLLPRQFMQSCDQVAAEACEVSAKRGLVQQAACFRTMTSGRPGCPALQAQTIMRTMTRRACTAVCEDCSRQK